MQDTPVLVEIDDSVEFPIDRIQLTTKTKHPGDFQEVVDLSKLEREFLDIKTLIVTCCNTIYEGIAGIHGPQKIGVEFGIKLAGESGFPMVTKASGEANFKINVEWNSAENTDRR